MITNDGFLFLSKCIKDNITFPQARISGTWRNGDIQDIETTEKSVIIKCYFSEIIVGKIESYRLLLKNGNTLLAKNDTIVKDDSRGLLVVFEINITED